MITGATKNKVDDIWQRIGGLKDQDDTSGEANGGLKGQTDTLGDTNDASRDADDANRRLKVSPFRQNGGMGGGIASWV